MSDPRLRISTRRRSDALTPTLRGHWEGAGGLVILLGSLLGMAAGAAVAEDLTWKQAFGDDVKSAGGRRQGWGRRAARATIGRADCL